MKMSLLMVVIFLFQCRFAHNSFLYVIYYRLVHAVVSHPSFSTPDAPVGSFGVSCRQGYEFPTSRGGLLVHKPSDDMDRFPHFVQPFMRPLEDPAPLHVTDDAWKQQMIHLHNQEADAPKKRGRAPRGAGQKRKRVEGEEELVWSLENMLQTRNKEEQCHPSAVLGEDDAFTFEHLYLRHGGNVEAAELNLLVDLSSGRGKEYGLFFLKFYVGTNQTHENVS